MFLKKDDFFAWLDEYTRGKRNDLQRSQTAIPKRSEKIVLDLSSAPLQPVQINTPFKSLTFVEARAGGIVPVICKISVILDSSNTGNEKNSITMKPGDTFNQDQVISRAFITWKAQPGIEAELIFLEDSQLYSAGNEVWVQNTVQVQGTVEVTQLTDPWIVKTQEPVSVREFPRYTLPFNVPPSSGASYTVPTGEYWKMNFSVHNPNPSPLNLILLDSTIICNPQEKGFWAWEWNDILEGNTIDIQTDAGTTGIQGFFACYKIT